jgi:hypothetical protein
VRFAVIALAIVVLQAAAVRAQGVGFTGGVGLDPSQVYAGTFVESPPLGGGRIHFRPGIDGASGSGVSDAIIDVFFIYKIPAGALSRWTLYQGTGAVVAIERANEELHPHGGFGGLFGVANANGFFFEFKLSGGGGPNLRLGVGYMVRRKQP